MDSCGVAGNAVCSCNGLVRHNTTGTQIVRDTCFRQMVKIG